MTGITHILRLLGRFAPQAMAAGVFIGLLLPFLADVLRPLLAPSIWALLMLSVLRVDMSDMVGQLRRPMLPIAVTLWMAVITPSLMAGILFFVDLRPGIEAAMIFAAASSSLFSTPVLGMMFGLRGALLLVVLVCGTILVPLSLPLMSSVLLGFEIGADPLTLMTRMAVFVATAMGAALVLRRIMGAHRVQRHAPSIDGLSVILLITFAVAIMDGLTARFLTQFWDTLGVTALAFAVYGGMIVAGAGISHMMLRGRDPQTALSIGFISGARNLAMVLAVLPVGVDSDIPLFFAVGQFPIYIMPMILKPVFLRLLRPRSTSTPAAHRRDGE